MAPAKSIGVKELASELDTNPRELRKFLRARDFGVGLGSRYEWPSISDSAVRAIVKAWNENADG
jgi:hypothetical protein